MKNVSNVHYRESKDLKVFICASGETPEAYMNNFEADTRGTVENLLDFCHSIEKMIDEGYMEWEKSDIFFDFHDLEGTRIHHFNVSGEVTMSEFIRFMENEPLVGTCQTLGILGAGGALPAVAMELEYRNSYVSFYACPIYKGEVPSEHSFNRFFNLFK